MRESERERRGRGRQAGRQDRRTETDRQMDRERQINNDRQNRRDRQLQLTLKQIRKASVKIGLSIYHTVTPQIHILQNKRAGGLGIRNK